MRIKERNVPEYDRKKNRDDAYDRDRLRLSAHRKHDRDEHAVDSDRKARSDNRGKDIAKHRAEECTQSPACYRKYSETRHVPEADRLLRARDAEDLICDDIRVDKPRGKRHGLVGLLRQRYSHE